MAATTNFIGVSGHFFSGLGDNLPFHALPRFISGSGNLVKRFIEGKIVSNRILDEFLQQLLA
jgi:hypothetical protein